MMQKRNFLTSRRPLLGFLFLCCLGSSSGLRAQKVAPDERFQAKVNANVFSVLEEPNGNIFLAGAFSNQGPFGNRNGLMLVDAHGEFLPNFGGDNSFIESTSSSGIVLDIAPCMHNGEKKYIVVGDFKTFNGKPLTSPYIVRLKANGELDPTFAPPRFGHLSASYSTYLRRVVVLSDGKMLISGTFAQVNDRKQYGIARLNADGTLDTTFRCGTGFKSSFNTVEDMEVLPDGKILVCGSFTSFNGEFKVARMARLNADGTRDATFHSPDVAKTDFFPRDMEVQPDGKIVLAGDFEHYDGYDGGRYIVRLNADGTIDKSFAFSGVQINEDANAGAYAVKYINKKYYLGMGKDFIAQGGTLWRLNADGSVDKTFLPGKQQPDGDVTGLFVDGKNHLYVSGTFSNIASKRQPYFVRFNVEKENTIDPIDIDVESDTSQGYKVLFRTDFENVTVDSEQESIVSINGIRWRMVNCSIETSPFANIPEGKRALSIRANNDPDNPQTNACFEMIDDFVPHNAPEYCIYRLAMNGIDGILTDSGWKIAFSYDRGKTWGWTPLIVPRTCGIVDAQFPPKGEKSPMRVKFFYDGEPSVKGQRILLDDITLFSARKYGNDVPTRFAFINIHDGYRTHLTTLPIKIDFRSNHGLTNPDDPLTGYPFFDSYVQVKLDGKHYKDLHRITLMDEPVEWDFVMENLAPGKHTLEIILMKLDKTEYGPDRYALKADFFVGEKVVQLKGIDALRNAEVGKIYEITPASGNEKDKIYCNLYSTYRFQRVLFDGKASIMVDDPYGFNPFKEEVPQNGEFVEKMVGILLEQNGLKVFRLTEAMTLVGSNDKYVHKAPQITDFSSLASQEVLSKEEGALKVLSGKFSKEYWNKRFHPGTRALFTDGITSLPIYMLNANRLIKFTGESTFPEGGRHILTIITRDFLTGEYVFSPIIWQNFSGLIEASAEDGFFVQSIPGFVRLTAPDSCRVSVFTLGGEEVIHCSLDRNRDLALPQGNYIVLMQTDRHFFVAKAAVR